MQHKSISVILSGPEGVGKCLLAVAYAKFLNCNSESDGPCECWSCSSSVEEHPNIIKINGDEAKIDDVRGIVLPGNRPWKNGVLVRIVDNAHSLSVQAISPLLKAIEDRENHTVWLLVTHDPGRILDTIRTRCINIRCSTLTSKDTTKVLQAHDCPSVMAHDLSKVYPGKPGKIISYWKTKLALQHKCRQLIDSASLVGMEKTIKFAHEIVDEYSRVDILDVMGELIKVIVASGDNTAWKTVQAGICLFESHPSVSMKYALSNFAVQRAIR